MYDWIKEQNEKEATNNRLVARDRLSGDGRKVEAQMCEKG